MRADLRDERLGLGAANDMARVRDRLDLKVGGITEFKSKTPGTRLDRKEMRVLTCAMSGSASAP